MCLACFSAGMVFSGASDAFWWRQDWERPFDVLAKALQEKLVKNKGTKHHSNSFSEFS